MLAIDNLKEKELLIAYYFCGNKRKSFTLAELYDMWCNWFKDDFRVNGKSVFKVEGDRLCYRKGISVSDEGIRREYENALQSIYKWIKQILEKDCHDKAYLRKLLDKERKKEYRRLVKMAKPLNIYVLMKTSYKQLAKFSLAEYGNPKHTLTGGDCDRMIRYMKQMPNKSNKKEVKENTGSGYIKAVLTDENGKLTWVTRYIDDNYLAVS